MDRKEAIDLALNLFRQDLDKNDVVNTLMRSNIPESTAYRYAKKALDQYEWEDDSNGIEPKSLELNALHTIYKAMKWAETNNEPELAVKYANLYITNKKRLKKGKKLNLNLSLQNSLMLMMNHEPIQSLL